MKTIVTLTANPSLDANTSVDHVVAERKLRCDKLDFEPGGMLASASHFPGTEELIVVLSGRFRVVSGENAVDLSSGDSLRFPADVEHSIENRSTRRAKAMLIVHHLESGPGVRRDHSVS